MPEKFANGDDGWRPVHALILATLMGMAGFVPVFRMWPLLWVVPLAAYAAIVAVVPPLRATVCSWRFGRICASSVLATIIVTVGSCAVLVAFHCFTHPDVSAYGSFLPVSTFGGVFSFGVAFSTFNALFEEITFRGVLFDAVESQWGVWCAVIATAFLFGYSHLRGYPGGTLGAVLAGIYGLCIGWLRAFSGGIGLGVVAHIAADATIFILIARSGVF